MINLASHFRSVSFVSALLSVGLLSSTACNTASGPVSSPSASSSTVRLAYFPNVTHGVALVGVGRGTFAKALGDDTKLETQVFTAGPAEIEALFAGAVDIGYIGPGPAINGYLKSKGQALKII